ncbi:MAG: SDR family oxidoreductase [Rhodospirillales bacterium]
MELGLAGRVVVVTGGGSGIGAAIVEDLVREGARPVILGRDAPDPDWLAGPGGNADFIVLELADDDACRRAADDVREKWGPIYGLVNNAGANDSVGLEAGPEAFRQSLDRNLVHYYTLAHLFADDLRRSGGAVVNVSSKTAVTGQGDTSAYVAAKAAQLGLTREWAAAFADAGVRVNAVVPAEVMTPLYRDWLGTFPDPDARLAEITARIPLGQRMTEPSEIAAMVVFALSNRARHLTGQWLFVDGGYTHLDRALERRAT